MPFHSLIPAMGEPKFSPSTGARTPFRKRHEFNGKEPILTASDPISGPAGVVSHWLTEVQLAPECRSGGTFFTARSMVSR